MMSYKKVCSTFLLMVVLSFCCYTTIVLFTDPLEYLDGEAAWHFENREFSKHHEEYVKNLVIGDSVAKVGFYPRYLSDDTYNFALGGASPMEEYFYLREYLEHNEAPKTILCGFLPSHLVDCSTFWSRGVYFHRISYDDACEVFKNIGKYKNTGTLKRDKWNKELVSYFLYSPEKYGMAIMKAVAKILLPVKSRYEMNREIYLSVKKDRGHCFFGKRNEWNCPNYYIDWVGFAYSDMMVEYLYRLVDLCEQKNIRLIYCAMPINDATYNLLKPKFKEEYTSFLQEFQNRYPKIIVETDICHFSNDCFGDATHLNEKGCKLFSDIIRAKYIGSLK